jgi:hypothetical protein
VAKSTKRTRKTPVRTRSRNPTQTRAQEVAKGENDTATQDESLIELELQLTPEEEELLGEVRSRMTIARNDAEAVMLSLQFTRWVISLKRQGYIMAMIKDNDLKPVEGFVGRVSA